MISIGTPYESGGSTCGYCSPPGSRSEEATSIHIAELVASQLTCDAYQKMIDRGWRRSGTFCYKPDMKRTCCPQYVIRLGALEFTPSKSQRKLVNRWNRYVKEGSSSDGTSGDAEAVPPNSMSVDTAGQMAQVKLSNGSKSKQSSSKPSSKLVEWKWPDSLHASEHSFLNGEESIHNFEVTLEPASYTEEKFILFEKYQRDIHKDEFKDPSGFKRFLCNSPLIREDIPYTSPPPPHLPKAYGSYHQMYRIDGRLFAFGVLDILPRCVSSVYFVYDTEWERFSLGRLSALREAALVLEMHNCGAPGMDYSYLGYYIHTCQKMRYKGAYSPSYLADPETYEWFPLPECVPLLDKYPGYACFAHPEHSFETTPPLEEQEKEEPKVGPLALSDVLVLHEIKGNEVTVVPAAMSNHLRSPTTRRALRFAVQELGPQLAKEIIFDVSI